MVYVRDTTSGLRFSSLLATRNCLRSPYRDAERYARAQISTTRLSSSDQTPARVIEGRAIGRTDGRIAIIHSFTFDFIF